MNDGLNEWGVFNEPDSDEQVSILEIGPWKRPARGYIDQYLNRRLVFVDFRSKSSELALAYPDATFVQCDILDYLDGDDSIPEAGFDVVIMRNILSGARQSIQGRPDKLLNKIGAIVRIGGRVIIDETLDATDMRYGQSTKEILEQAGFTVSLSNDPDDYHAPLEYHEDAFHIEAIKN